MSKKKFYKTIKEAAEALLMEVSYVDVYGRNVGLTYLAILKKLHENFPTGSKNWPGLRTSLRSSFKTIARMVKRKFPEYGTLSNEQMTGLALHLSKHFKLPPRPED